LDNLEAQHAEFEDAADDNADADMEGQPKQPTTDMMESGMDKQHVANPGGDLNEGTRRQHMTYAEKTTELRYEVSHDEYLNMVKQLNKEQRVYHHDIMHRIKHHSGNPFYHFLSGGAGVGKSVLTRAITQGVMRWANKQQGSEDTCLKVLVMAYTNKAANNVGGTTPFSGLGIPINTQPWSMLALSDRGGRRAQYVETLRQLKLIII
jgi:hypothetical protein